MISLTPRSRTTESEGSKELKGGRIVRSRTRILGLAISYIRNINKEY